MNDDELLQGHIVMPKLGNATAKAELGRASWKLLHTMAARFPEEPSESDRMAFKSFLYMFARVYPCGECAAEFQQLLRNHPPQTSSRQSASIWLCVVHNKVNERLGKDEFDCSQNLEGLYDCGCGEQPTTEARDKDVKRDGHERQDDDSEYLAQTNASHQESVRYDDRGRRIDPVTGARLVGG
ncbi:hypothetical protein OIO90_000737 [Microbotryomycetes sp. JL221]|nr:hypothetical protein OIO90_000737 [Microbotryomycetes sp. JL221]